ncbi:SIR2 family protein [Pseudomonas sp. NPDC089401]|uniref:SIR2 family protein n=1 Tax=Pseudomonas sp. NPDC089401 TaxID=3364462 RepID=UPI003802C53C
MSITNTDATTQLAFSMFENPGVYAVLLGSGVSRSAGIPTGWEITLDLVRRAGIAAGAGEQGNWHSWYVNRHKQEPNYSTLLEELGSTPKERQRLIEGFLSPTEDELEQGLKLPTPAHRAIADLVKSGHVRVIITTNFDRLMENALRDVGLEPTVVSTADGFAGAEPLTHTDCYILKLHGDFKDARILNTDSELSEYPAAFDALLDRILDEFGLIVAGWSGDWDRALRAAIMRAPNRRYSSYWLTRGKLSERAQELVSHRRATPAIAPDADTFFQELSSKVATIHASRQPNPASVELTVAMAKRYLSKSEYRIQLDDLIVKEVERTTFALSDMYDSDGDGTGEFGDWVLRYEAATDPLARIAGVIGRWGSQHEHNLILEVIQTLLSRAYARRVGHQGWIELKRYPAALVFYGYGLGLTQAGRLADLYALMEHPIANRTNVRIPLTEELSPYCLEDLTGSRSWESLVPSRTLYDRVAEVLMPTWAPSFAGLADPTQLYERFELFCLLQLLKYRDIDEESLADGIRVNQFKRWVHGRLGMISSARRRLSEEMAVPEFRAPLADAGFGFGSGTYLEKFFSALQRVHY